MYFVYLLKCKNGNIYTGITTDIERRFKEHRDGKGGHYTKSVGVIEIIRTEQYNDRSAALKREAEIKSWKREKKMDLIKSKHGS
ncbi:MAG: hypothetical protein A3C07_01095 [Candidatus Sungbacteria bacterium RIFCSPHIGHO2_02_FULL_47_11]|uniref:GIY-YIG domain-containing protein n=1 Tax=Candidatus Sungbacteria bacterium RIFCSPHIGHO2_02_FULL_47_11 TaxID=1802270 RepID=A0A1G2KPS3_9BACT|nr:MAG: hypothetical protein A3C07_01095 [Candidatus Sungbacteria bacterium RIFCSPHIGHO2_02_FULL_47_11]